MPLSVRDASAWKQVKGLWVRDASAWKQVKKAWVRDGGVWKQFFAAFADAQEITITVGTFSTGLPPPDDLEARGYSTLFAIGSRSPTSYMDSAEVSRTIVEAYWYFSDGNGGAFEFSLSGTTPDTDETFQRINVNGVVDLVRSAASFFQDGGTARWTWALASNPYPAPGNTAPLRVLFDASQS